MYDPAKCERCGNDVEWWYLDEPEKLCQVCQIVVTCESVRSV